MKTIVPALPLTATVIIKGFSLALGLSLSLAVAAQTHDFGDAPASYELNNTSSSVPARHLPSATLRINAIPDAESSAANVAAGADNNNLNGDGTDEDGVASTPPALTANANYSLTISVTNTTGGTRTLYGWIDFNNNGRFEVGEVISASVLNNATSATLLWPAATTRNALAPKLYMRLRFAGGATALADNGTTTAVDERSIADGANTGTYGTAQMGEVEDYQISVTGAYDYGDAPSSYEVNSSGVTVPARHTPTTNLSLGSGTPDAEAGAQSVTAGSDNNSSFGDGADENGISVLPLLTSGNAFSVTVSVTKNIAGTGNLYAWLDRNGNGRFEVGEAASTTPTTFATTSAALQTATLTWPAASVTGSLVYLRLRFTTTALADNAATATVDERSIAEGASGGVFGTPVNGEVEDYAIQVPSVFVSGTVWDDANGNLITDGTEAGTNTGGTLYVNMLDASNNIISSSTVASNGIYSMGMPTGVTGYKLVLTTSATGITPLLPGAGNTWVNTGENIGSGNTASQASSPVGEIALTTGASSITGQNFGIEQRPTGTNTSVTSQSNPGASTIIAVPSTVFNGSDAEDGTFGNNLNGKTVTLNAATGATLYYNNAAITIATTISSFNPSKVAVDPTATGATSPTFTYTVNDNAGVASLPITITVPFTAPTRTFSGTVWKDDNTNAIKDGSEIFTNAGNIYANLTSNASVVLQSVVVDATTGAYSVAAPSTGVAYKIVLSDGPKNIGVTLTGSSLPAYWVNTGVNLGGSANTVNQTGSINIAAASGNLTNRNFGVKQQTITAATCTPATGTVFDLYDRLIGGWHGTIMKNANGYYTNWGQFMQPGGYDGDDNNGQINPVDITPANGYNYTGTVLLATLGTDGRESQAFLLTSDGLYTWGYHGEILSTSNTTNNGSGGVAFQKMTVNAKTDGLPTGVTPTDVKMMTASSSGLTILTYSGHVYTLARYTDNYGDGTNNTGGGITGDAVWHQAKTNSTTVLSGVDIIRASTSGVLAITSTNNWYTWGQKVYLGNGTAETSLSYATLMTKPAAFTSYSDIKMIAMTNGSDHGSYYALHATNKMVYALGYNDEGQLGIGTTTTATSWTNVLQPGSGSTPLTNVKFISANDNDESHGAAGAIQEDGTLLLWGSNSQGMIGAGAAANSTRPRIPNGFVQGTDVATYLEVGGHFTEYIKSGAAKPCYTGHYVGGSAGNGSAAEAEITTFDCSLAAPVSICGVTSFDAGDAPVSYENGNYATHLLVATPVTLKLGTADPVDNSLNLKNVAAGANNNGTNGDGAEEDGIATIPDYTLSGSYSLTVTATNSTGITANMYAWIDWDNDGLFEASELQTATVNTGSTSTTLTWTGVPSSNLPAHPYIRVRLTSDNLADNTLTANVDERSTGSASNGEIEDYRLNVYYAVSGKVSNDQDGLNDGQVNGTGTNAGGLNAILYNVTTGQVASVVPVAGNGTYSFNSVTPGDNYRIYITTNSATVGQTAIPEIDLPDGWVNTGEFNGTGTGSDGSPDGILSLGTLNASITTANLGIEQKPTASMFNYTLLPVPTRGGTYPMDGTYRNMFPLDGNDEEDGPLGEGATFIITSLGIMDGNVLSYNGTAITGSRVITNYDPSLLTITFNNNGNSGFSFNYAVVDAAGVQSDPVSYTVSWGLGVLAIRLTAFEAEKKADRALLTWSATGKKSDGYFQLERSPDSRNWASLAKLPAIDGTGNHHYAYTDAAPLAGNNFYRLKQYNNDGTVVYSQVRLLKFDVKWRISLSPNPAVNTAFVQLYSNEPLASISIINAGGQVCMAVNRFMGNNITELNTTQLGKGIYIVQVVSAKNGVQNLKLVKN
ncbi:GEVED domain-containing protein [Foetidibacter luteolus]|uniref:GEVED domain-containing protein n=1 Tax=Foetidibacter luteolus TaxID=2608880 RepID=UPI001A98F17E|nr:GEVED domain-containing protein [Foetidibacter luteolus]